MKNSNFKLLFTTVILTLIVIWLKLDHSKPDKFTTNIKEGSDLIKANGRHLVDFTRAGYLDLCLQSDGTTLGYSKELSKAADTVSDYIANLTYYKNDQSDRIRKIIIDDDNSEVKSLVIDLLAGYIAFAVCGIITFIAWFFYLGCCCKPCCCCKQGAKDESWCSWKGVSCLIMIASLAGIAIACILGWIFASKFPDHVDKVECSFLRFYIDIKDGEDITTTPRWAGISEIVTSLTEIKDSLDKVYTNSQTAFSSTSDATSTKNSYYSLLDSKYDENKGSTTSNPNPNTASSNPTVIPSFIQQFGPRTNTSTVVGLFQQEYNYTITYSAELLQNLETYTDDLNKYLTQGKQIFQNAIEELTPLETDIIVFETDYIKPFTDNKEDVMDKLKIVFIVLYALVFILAFIMFFFTWCMHTTGKLICRWPAHLAWNLITVFTVVLFIIAAVFGLLGTAFIYSAPFIEVILSENGLNSILEYQSAELLNVCLNKDGNMRSVIFDSNTDYYTNIFDGFYNTSYVLDNITSQFDTSTQSQVAVTYKSLYSNMDSNIALAPVIDENSPSVVLNQLTLNTASSYPNNYISSCSSKTNDMWVSDVTYCTNGYTYVSSSSPTSNLGKASCLNVREWTSSTVNSRYTGRNSCSGSDNSATVANFVTRLNTFASDASPLLSNLSDDLNT